ncbi:hypothetical protein [Candidatus Berkiella aquae]|uniref:Uncharacterized protein n=1 Tax=Candidatus Berkiella aquae TaxID=295108 RepID=A0A0Q9YS23_9GAMM|nr:hypothetical protein [Candidatus Berkiella aquae]MCS5711941.1 hypothetical protein [Candidatus Berkiella aquae]
MFELVINTIASFLGGYFSQKTIEKKITLQKFFLSVFIIILLVSFSVQLLTDGISIKETTFGLLLSFLGALFCSGVLWTSFKIKNWKKK